jgi:hypothetical protein
MNISHHSEMSAHDKLLYEITGRLPIGLHKQVRISNSLKPSAVPMPPPVVDESKAEMVKDASVLLQKVVVPKKVSKSTTKKSNVDTLERPNKKIKTMLITESNDTESDSDVNELIKSSVQVPDPRPAPQAGDAVSKRMLHSPPSVIATISNPTAVVHVNNNNTMKSIEIQNGETSATMNPKMLLQHAQCLQKRVTELEIFTEFLQKNLDEARAHTHDMTLHFNREYDKVRTRCTMAEQVASRLSAK